MNFQSYYQPSPVRYIIVNRRSGFGPLTLLILGLAVLLFLYRNHPIVQERIQRLKHWVTHQPVDAPVAQELAEVSQPAGQPVSRFPGIIPPKGSGYAPKTYSKLRRYGSYENGFEKLSGSEGSSVTLRAVSFDKTAVNACPSRCSVTFYDHLGRNVTGVFFKETYAPKLLASHGKVTVTGTVQRSGEEYTLYLNRVL